MTDPGAPERAWSCVNPGHSGVSRRFSPGSGGPLAVCAECGLTSEMTARLLTLHSEEIMKGLAAQVPYPAEALDTATQALARAWPFVQSTQLLLRECAETVLGVTAGILRAAELTRAIVSLEEAAAAIEGDTSSAHMARAALRHAAGWLRENG